METAIIAAAGQAFMTCEHAQSPRKDVLPPPTGLTEAELGNSIRVWPPPTALQQHCCVYSSIINDICIWVADRLHRRISAEHGSGEKFFLPKVCCSPSVFLLLIHDKTGGTWILYCLTLSSVFCGAARLIARRPPNKHPRHENAPAARVFNTLENRVCGAAARFAPSALRTGESGYAPARARCNASLSSVPRTTVQCLSDRVTPLRGVNK